MMRALLTFIFVLLLVWRVDAATVSAPTIVEISPSTPVTSPLYLTNVLKNLSNNMVIRLLPGRHTVQVFPGSSGNVGQDAHMRLLLKTNITIEGLGPQSEIFHAQTGNVFSVSQSENITFKNFSIVGTRPVGTPPNTELYAAFNCESNNAITWDGIRFKDQFNHCIVNQSIKVSENCTVKNSWFENCANTNNWPASGYPGDGVCIHVIGSRMQILNNTFTNCGLCIEFQGETGAAGFRNILIAGNKFLAGIEPTILQYDTGPTLDGMYSDITIRDNTFKYLAGHGVGDTKIAIQINQMERVNIVDNTIDGAYIGIFYYAPYHIVGGRISGNIFQNTTYNGISTGGDSSFRGLIISDNYFTNVFGEGIFLDLVSKSRISGNVFDNVADSSVAAGSIRLANADSNSITGNVMSRRGTSTLGSIYLEAGAGFNRITDNQVWDTSGAAYTDLGTDNRIQNNWYGTNFYPRMMVTDSLGVTNCTAAMTIGAPQTLKIRLTAAGAVTLNGTTAITDGYYDGQVLELIGTSDANTITINDAANTNLGANRVLGNQDVLLLRYDATASLWLENAFVNN